MVCYGSVVNFFTLGLCPPTQDMGGRKEFIMKAKAVRLHGANDLRLDEFELPEITDD